jgi:uncharacterized protein (DUF433 family)
VPVVDLLDYLAGGDNPDVFLDNFPSVSREQAIRAIGLAAQKLLEGLPVK